MRLAGVQSAANAHDKRGWMLANKQIFSLFRRLSRVEVLQLLRGYKGDFAAEPRVELGIVPLELVERAADCLDNAADSVFQRVGVALVLRDDALPVPLVHVNGVQVIRMFVATDSVHVADQAATDGKVVAPECIALPFCERLNYLGVFADVWQVKCNRMLDTIEVVVHTGKRVNNQWSGDARQLQCGAQLGQKHVLDLLNCFLSIVKRKA